MACLPFVMPPNQMKVTYGEKLARLFNMDPFAGAGNFTK